MNRPSARKLALYGLIASLVISGLLGIVALLVQNFGKLQAKVLLTSLAVSAASILALACATALERNRFAGLARAGIAAATLTAVLVLITVWFEIDNEYYFRVIGSVGTVAIAMALCSLLSIASLVQKFELTRTAAFVASFLLASALVVLYWTELDDNWYFRMVGILSICVTVLTILVPVFHKVSEIQLRAARLVQDKVNLEATFDSITDTWSPVVVASLASGHVIRAARVLGQFHAHSHTDQDEFFLVIRGSLRIRFADRTVTLNEGEGLLVPAGVIHQPEADSETHILLFEPESTKPTGNS